MRAQILFVAAAVAVAGCSAGASQPVPKPSARTAATASPSAPDYTAGDIQACQAFYDATTTGIPAGMAPEGTDTMTWLTQQAQGADPQLQGTIDAFVNSFSQSPPDMTGIRLATAAIKGDCKPYGGG